MKKVRAMVGVVGLAGILTVAWAEEKVSNPHWLSDSEIAAVVANEPPPPALNSAAGKADLQGELDAQKARTPERIAEARQDAGYSDATFASLIDPQVAKAGGPAARRFFQQLNEQITSVVSASKEHWRRLRPYKEHPDVIHPLFQVEGHSYPSGHATHAYAVAAILGVMFPNQAPQFLHRADQIAQSRVDAGVHYPSDIKEGHAVGEMIAQELLAKPAFEQAVRSAKLEMAGAR